jgi:alpha-2-macroglobulin
VTLRVAAFPIVVLLIASGAALAEEAATTTRTARVESFSPQGVMRGVREVAARFSEAMVALGDPRSIADPFEIDCPMEGASRWADGRSWVYTFKKDLPAGVRCRFLLRREVRTLAGTELGGTRLFTFSTGGPAVLRTHPWGGRSVGSKVAEDQLFALELDAEANPQSVEQHVSFAVSNLRDPVGVRIVEGADREAVLRAVDWKPDETRHVVLAARQRFAPGSKLLLRWGRGVETKSGVARDSDQTFAFEVREPFTVRLACERENKKTDCIPLLPIGLEFSAPVSMDFASRIILREVPTEGAPQSASPPRSWPALRFHATNGDPLVESLVFRGPFPLHATLRAELPEGLVDAAGRAPEGAHSLLEVQTGGYPPLAKFAARFGILEAASPVLPVTVRNLEAGSLTPEPSPVTGRLAVRHEIVSNPDAATILGWLDALATVKRDESIFALSGLAASPTESELPRTLGKDAFEVVGIPLQGTGLHVVEIESRVLGESLLGSAKPLFVPAGALVTNLSVHFKWGIESSIVWVTTLDHADPVAGARVTVADCSGTTLAEGTTDAQGLVRFEGLPQQEKAPACKDFSGSDYKRGLLVIARTEGDLGLVHTSWNEGIEPWRFRLPTEWRPQTLRAHTVFDRTLMRAGDTVHMKHVLRRLVQAGFAQVPPGERPEAVRIVHVGSDEHWDLPITWSPDGTALTDWTIPKESKLGLYETQFLSHGEETPGIEVSGSFRVEAFRVPLMRATLQPPKEALVSPREFPLNVAVQYLAGGGASGLPVKLRTQIQKHRAPEFPDYPRFDFAEGGVTEGLRVRRFGEGDLDFEREWDWGEGAELGVVWRVPEGGSKSPVATQEFALDASGTQRVTVHGLPRADEPLEVQAELEFRDPNGETQTASRTIPLWPSARIIGLSVGDAGAVKDSIHLRTAVLGLDGDPVWLAKVEIDAFEHRVYSTRKRIVGGFYAYEYVDEIRRIGPFCSGRTDLHGTFECEGAPPREGQLVFVARTQDRAGRQSVTKAAVFVPGADDSWFAQSDDDRMELLPAKQHYEPGETARFEVRMPFREATVLVSVEREGVGTTFVKKLSGRNPVLKVPIEGRFAPNVFVSVLALRGRVDAPAPTARVDLAKPAYRLGIAEIKVGRKENELAVRVTPEHSTYRVREKANVRVAVRTAAGGAPPPGSEIAVAAVDEGLLELMPNDSWNLLSEMMGRRSYGVLTSTAQMQVVGKRHFGLKALPSGGGGGQRATRELFDTLLLWRGRVPLDAKGDAAFEIPLNDSLTSFRITAIATGGDALFGTGGASIRTTQDLMILPGLPPLVREADRFQADFTIRNTTSRPQDVKLAAQVEGLSEPLAPLALHLGAGEAREASWDVNVPIGVAALGWNVVVATSGGTEDHLHVSQRVVPAVPPRVLQATLTQLAPSEVLSVERPSDALPGVGGIELALRPKLADGRDGIERAMREYPYDCLEQRISIAIALRDPDRWKSVIGALPSYLDADGLAKFFPSMREGSEVLTSYLLTIADESGFEIPPPLRDRMLSALERLLQGKLVRNSVLRAADFPLRKLAAADALARYGRATPALVGSIPVEEVALLPNSGLLDLISILERVPGIPDGEARLSEANRVLRAHLDVQGTTLGFATSRGGVIDWLLATKDVNANRLVLSRLTDPSWHEEVPRLMRGALSLQQRGAWGTPIANAWGVLALEKFSKAFEATPVGGVTTATLGGETQHLDWSGASDGGPLHFPWPDARARLALRHEGSGSPWALVQSVAAVPLRAPFSSGYRIERRLEPVTQRVAGVWSRGDVVRVHLQLDAEADASWVVVSDPIPTGATILGSGLGGDSALATAGEQTTGWGWPAFVERGQEVYRSYYEFVPKGHLGFDYTVRINQAGRFGLPPTRVEAMYSPERFGELPNETVEVQP